jgi:homoserine dehydrogenase
MKSLKIGMLGCGVVGLQIAKLLISNRSDLSSRAGADLELVKIAVRDSKVKREGVPSNLFTSDSKSVVTDPTIDLIIEVIGGIEPAKELILSAISNGKSVITANKALLAKHGAELYAAADKANVDLYYEAAVAGAIPILRPLRESLVGDHVLKVMGIVNGTTNYILTKMDENGAAFSDALNQAQQLGFAEADPSSDIEGVDAAAKAAILASLAFHSRVTDADVYREGIAKEHGYGN